MKTTDDFFESRKSEDEYWGWRGFVDCRPGGQRKRKGRRIEKTKKLYPTHAKALHAAHLLSLDLIRDDLNLWTREYAEIETNEK